MEKDFLLLIVLLIGIVFGYVLALGIVYPLDIAKYEKITEICKDKKVTKIKINAAGSIKFVECGDGLIYHIDSR